jgi:hypothetical protein
MLLMVMKAMVTQTCNLDDDETESKVKSKPSKNSEVGGSFDSEENDIPDSETEKAANKNLDTIVRNR